MRYLARLGAAGAAAFFVSACNLGSDLPQSSAISECGGFGAQLRSSLAAVSDYCDAEVLLWSYDSETQTLALENNRILLNCCGDHSMTVTEEEGVYVVTERDAPEFGDARCGCMCVFDFTVDVEEIPAGVIDIELVREITDDGIPPFTVYEGSIDLGDGSGEIVIDDADVEPWCSGEEA